MQTNLPKLLALMAASLIPTTAARAADITITNASFESGAIGDYYGVDYQAVPPALDLDTMVGWTITNGDNGHFFIHPASGAGVDGAAQAGYWFGGSNNTDFHASLTYSGAAPLGTVQANTVYTLALEVTCPSGAGTATALTSIQLTADGVPIATGSVSRGQGSTGTISAIFDTSVDSSHDGQALGIIIDGIKQNNTNQAPNTFFDNVRLTTAAVIPHNTANLSFELNTPTDYASNDYTVGQGATADSYLTGWNIVNAPTGHFFNHNQSDSFSGNPSGAGVQYMGLYSAGSTGGTATLTSAASHGTFAANTAYTLTMQVGIRQWGTAPFTSLRLTDGAGGTALSETDTVTSVPGTSPGWYTLAATYITGASGGVVGHNIGIQIGVSRSGTAGEDVVACFDNVQLTSVAVIPTTTPNPSFELGLAGNYYGLDSTGGYPLASFVGWTPTNASNGHFFMLPNDHSTIPDGSRYAGYWFGSATGSHAQLTYSATPLGNFQANTHYTLAMSVGSPTWNNASAEASIHLTANGVDIGVATAVNVPADTWQTINVSFDTLANSAYNGQAIGIYIDAVNNGSSPVVNFDNVQFQSAPSSDVSAAYLAWTTAFSGFTDTNPTHDPDGDGLTNQQEFAFGLDPTKGSSSNPISVPLDKATGTFRYTRLATSGLGYVVYTSPDLSTWTADSGATQSVISTANDVDTVQVTLSPPHTDTKLFVRIGAQ
jgi:hypothetical protein